ncbi:hypothetical protein ADK67_21735 [Saccharothrix sp. NRRL B-16348]|uniref:hypothetical protein n=1 Tax=Saccharothrix sp. NRRL B-16348 TaxID=1415542 RepID=UPI0006C6CC61|nr:hypothetical protein [Saccharothrix sp. NRRL B-16348]KOX23226.1 hypothetical protein ADK67_21735 [Saccharothrix sp. NRRL B-16348]
MPPSTRPAASPDTAGGLLFGDEAARWLGGRAEQLLPAQARPAAVRRTWLVLAVVLLTLAGVAVAIRMVL